MLSKPTQNNSSKYDIPPIRLLTVHGDGAGMPVETHVLSWSRCGGLSAIATLESHTTDRISLGRGTLANVDTRRSTACWVGCSSEGVPAEARILQSQRRQCADLPVSSEHPMLSLPWQQPLTVVIPVRTIWMLGRGGQNRVRYPTYSIYSLKPFNRLFT